MLHLGLQKKSCNYRCGVYSLKLIGDTS